MGKLVAAALLSTLVCCSVAPEVKSSPNGGCVGCVASEGPMLATLAHAGFDWSGTIVWGAELPKHAWVVVSDDCSTIWVTETEACDTEAWWWIAECAAGPLWGTDSGYEAVDNAWGELCL